MKTWKQNRLTERLGLDVPIIQAPMAGATTPEMAVAVSGRGGLGSLGCLLQSLDKTRHDCEVIRTQTNRAFNINFSAHKAPLLDEDRNQAALEKLAPFYKEFGIDEIPAAEVSSEPFNENALTTVLEIRPTVISFHYGLPSNDLVFAIKEAGLFTISSATTVKEALMLEAAGADALVAQGFEAAGHRGTIEEPYEDGWIGTMALVPQIVDAVSIPVIAAGGIMDGRGIAAALALGAEGVQMGTAFLGCPESSIPAVYRSALLDRNNIKTELSSAFSGRPARGIENRFIKEMKGIESDFPDFPILNTLTGPLRKVSAEAGNPDFVALWAGQGYGMSRAMPAADLLDTLVDETDEVLNGLS